MSDPTIPPSDPVLPPATPVQGVGAPIAYSSPGLEFTQELDPQARNLAMVGYLLNLTVWIGPLIVYLLKKDDPTTKPYTRQELTKALNWGITMQIGIIIGIVTTPIFCVGFIFNIALVVTNIVFVILNAMKANRGEPAGVPFAIKFIK